MGLTIAKEVERKQRYHPEVTSFERLMAKTKIEKCVKDVLKNKPKTLKDFTDEMKKKGIIVSEAKNKKGNTYGLRFSGYGQTFKASQIGKEFGHRILLNTFSDNRLAEYQSKNQAQSQSINQDASIVEEVLSGLSSIITPSNYSIDDSGLTVAEEEERKRKHKKKRRYGRQQ